ncbi:MAG: hypothetical protein AB8B82_16895 [Roseovarius sp.]
METVFHLGAHRTASTCFQYYLRENVSGLARQGIATWGPRETRDGLLTGVIPLSGTLSTGHDQLRRARGRISLARQRLRDKSVQQLVVSDENMIGAPRRNLRDRKLYAGIGERMARFQDAFGHDVQRIVFSIRAQDMYWSSVLAYAVGRGHKVPDTDELDRLVTSNRMWRDVIRDLACAMPDTEILVLPYEQFGGRPELKLNWLTGCDTPPMKHAREWINRAPSTSQLRQILLDRRQDPDLLPNEDGRWQPFDEAQRMALRESYADDLFWLRAGADGMATLIEETGTDMTGQILRSAQTTRGQDNGIEERRLA